LAINGFGNPGVDPAAVFGVPAFDNAEVDVAAGTESTSNFPCGVIVVDDRGVGTAYATRRFNMLKVLGVAESVFALDPTSGLVARITQSNSVFRHIGMVDTPFVGAAKSVEAQA
jgi:hypothetical protein